MALYKRGDIYIGNNDNKMFKIWQLFNQEGIKIGLSQRHIVTDETKQF
jgi:hypothetical protein